MKRQIDFEKAATAESFGALAVSSRNRRGKTGSAVTSLTPAQIHALSELLGSLVEIVREAGANHQPVKVGDVLLELREKGAEEILSIRKVALL